MRVENRNPLLTLEHTRRDQRKTIVDIARAARVGPWLISLLESGRATPTPDQARRIAKALGLDPEVLLVPVKVVTVPPEPDADAEKHAETARMIAEADAAEVETVKR